MKKIGLIFAMKKEMRPFEGKFPAERVRCALSGIGKVNAAVCAQKLILEFAPDCIISVGCAGSFSEKVRVGDIVIAKETAYHDFLDGEEFGHVPGLPPRFPSDERLVAVASEYMSDAHSGLICSGDQFFVGEFEDKRQKELYPDALAVDMESAAIAQVCCLYSVPFVSVRAISDMHTDEHQTQQYENFWKNGSEGPFCRIGGIIESLLDTAE